MLTPDQIAKLAARKGVKSVAVVNFLGSLGDMTARDAYANFQQDNRVYKWNAETTKAIYDGLSEHFK